MNSCLQNVIPTGINSLRCILSLLLAVSIARVGANAQQAWQIDPQDSVATYSMESGVNTFQVGLARVSGKVVFEASDPEDPVVTFEISSGNPNGAEYATMNFISKTSTITADGKLIVTGDLAVTCVARKVTMDPSEAYAGAQYGDPVSSKQTRQIKLVFAGLPQISNPNGVMHLVGSAIVVREDFPHFLDAVSTPEWPTELINDEKCENPSIIGEDYHGADCTGTVIASINNAMVPTGAPSGGGFYGFEPIVTPDQNSATIALNLQLKEMPSVVSSR